MDQKRCKKRKTRRNRKTKTWISTHTRSRHGRTYRVSGHPRRLPRKPVRRIIISQGAIRVSDEAADELADELELHGKKISRSAIVHARKDGRQTVKKRDIEQAAAEYHTSFHREK